MVGIILNIIMEMEKMNFDRIERKIDKLRSDIDVRLNNLERDIISFEKSWIGPVRHSECRHLTLALVSVEVSNFNHKKDTYVYRCLECDKRVYLDF